MSELNTDKEDTVLPRCPFCGKLPRTGNIIYVKAQDSSFPEFVECYKCNYGFYGPGAKKKWSNRVPHKPTNLISDVINYIIKKTGGKNDRS